uniref:Uncharacterized protein n=1 Tax=Kalanchoe fedtschenkoi TaxID=63787 RepID=A0A7N0RAM1_KALFE
MEKRSTKMSTSDEKARRMDIVKAAAHAWLEHGSAGRKPMSEFETSSSGVTTMGASYYKASRFKLEAAAAGSKINSRRHGRVKMHSMLLDEYEVARIVRNLEQVVVLDGSRRARELAGYLDGGERNKEKESKKGRGGRWIKRGFACPTDMNDVAVATARRKSTSGLNPPRPSNLILHVLRST